VGPVLAELLLRAGLGEGPPAKAFLQPVLAGLDDPFRLNGVEAAVARLRLAITGRQSLVVLGDYDVDGVSSTALLVGMLRRFGLDPRFDGAHTGLARSLEALGRYDEARKECEEAIRVSAGVAGPIFGLAHLEATMGNEKEARRMLAELIEARKSRIVSAWGIGVLYASLGDIDEAFRWLEIAVDEQAPGIIMLRVHPRLDPIRKDPRYTALVRRLGLDAIP